ncbi:transcriptional regulator MraZ-like [Oratosquilla oratoria]|uniref:transcriptional regulator MraZ-like n=1 Tax=Oratosquilla oratoria TaxID=337810 RepID=UPI003F765592
MVLTLDRSACLLLFPRPIFQQFERELMELKSSRQATLFRRIYLGMAADVRMDGSGRILIPTVLRERAGLKAKDERISMVGQGHKFELWAESAWNAFLDEAIDELADLEIGGADAGADLANLSML